jgi:hypothetical protein
MKQSNPKPKRLGSMRKPFAQNTKALGHVHKGLAGQPKRLGLLPKRLAPTPKILCIPIQKFTCNG